MKLSTIQKREKLNYVHANDEFGPGGAHHDYTIVNAENNIVICNIHFQKGPRKEPESREGVMDTDLLEIVRDRLRGFQSGDFATRDNAIALTHIEDALLRLNMRVEDRIERGVLGENKK